MTKRNPHRPTRKELRALAAQGDRLALGLCETLDLAVLTPDELTSWLSSVQAEAWQEPLRQMEG